MPLIAGQALVDGRSLRVLGVDMLAEAHPGAWGAFNEDSSAGDSSRMLLGDGVVAGRSLGLAAGDTVRAGDIVVEVVAVAANAEDTVFADIPTALGILGRTGPSAILIRARGRTGHRTLVSWKHCGVRYRHSRRTRARPDRASPRRNGPHAPLCARHPVQSGGAGRPRVVRRRFPDLPGQLFQHRASTAGAGAVGGHRRWFGDARFAVRPGRRPDRAGRCPDRNAPRHGAGGVSHVDGLLRPEHHRGGQGGSRGRWRRCHRCLRGHPASIRARANGRPALDRRGSRGDSVCRFGDVRHPRCGVRPHFRAMHGPVRPVDARHRRRAAARARGSHGSSQPSGEGELQEVAGLLGEVDIAASALSIVIAAAIGMGVQVENFRADFYKMLDQRLWRALYIESARPVDTQWLRRQPGVTDVRSYGRTEALLNGRPITVTLAVGDALESRRYGYDAALAWNKRIGGASATGGGCSMVDERGRARSLQPGSARGYPSQEDSSARGYPSQEKTEAEGAGCAALEGNVMLSESGAVAHGLAVGDSIEIEGPRGARRASGSPMYSATTAHLRRASSERSKTWGRFSMESPSTEHPY